MWLLPSWQRPELCRRAIEACAAMGMTSRGVLFIDPPHDGYHFPVPDNWTVVRSTERVGMAAAHRYVFDRFPDEDSYCFIADDNVPITPGWDKALEGACWNEERKGFWNVAFCDDDFFISARKRRPDGTPHDLGGLPCIGGDLARAVGWWALPGVFQCYIDDAWNCLSRELKVRCYVESVTVEHYQWRTGRREKDATDTVSQDHAEGDLDIFNRWMQQEFNQTIERVRAAWTCDTGSSAIPNQETHGSASLSTG